jgi:hypothetical protein
VPLSVMAIRKMTFDPQPPWPYCKCLAMKPRSLIAAVAFVSALGVGTLVAADFLPHTDDGCTVEIHCLACRLSVATTTAHTPAISLPVVLVVAEAVTSSRPQQQLESHRSPKPSRGPPAL